MPYWRLHYHLVWATFERAALITPSVEPVVYSTILAKAREMRLFLHAAGGIEDHVHVVVSIPPTCSVSEVVKRLKGASSRATNVATVRTTGLFRWQEGYGALTIGDRSLNSAIEYVEKQKEHHARGTAVNEYEQMEHPSGNERG